MNTKSKRLPASLELEECCRKFFTQHADDIDHCNRSHAGSHWPISLTSQSPTTAMFAAASASACEAKGPPAARTPEISTVPFSGFTFTLTASSKFGLSPATQ